MRRLVPAILVVACSTAITPLPRSQPAIHGPVLRVVARDGAALPLIFVQADTVGWWDGPVWVHIGDQTPVLWRSGSRARLADLSPGAVVSVWTTAINESDPAGAGADTVVIEAPAYR